MCSKWLQEREGESAPCDKIQIQKLKEDNTLYALYYSAHREAVQNLRSRVHERTISLRFLGIILRVLRLEVSVSIL